MNWGDHDKRPERPAGPDTDPRQISRQLQTLLLLSLTIHVAQFAVIVWMAIRAR
jgi:hypothetical protein